MATNPIAQALSPFIWGRGGAALTPEQVAREREVAEALMAQGIDTSPVGDWTQGAARMANVLAGKIREGRASSAETAGREAQNALRAGLDFSNLFGGGSMAAGSPALGGSPAASTAMATAPAPDIATARVAQAHGDSTAPAGNLTESKQAFVNALLPAAMEESKRTGIDPRIIVAQAAQETGWGRSAPGNNYFGIKSHGKGGGQTLNTHEYVNGKRVNISDSFRRFDSPADSVRGYGEFILNNPRYGKLREAQGLDAQLEALQASGYATDPNYSRSVGAIARGIALPDAIAANEAMASGDLAANAVQDWAAQAYAPEQMASSGMQTDAPMLTWDGQGARVEPGGYGDRNIPGTVPYSGPGAQVGLPPSPGTQPRLPQAAPALPDPTMVQDMPVADIARSLTAATVNPDLPMAGNTSGFLPIAQSLAAQPQGGGMPPMQQIMELASSPWATDMDRQIAGALIKQQMEQADPYRQAQIEKLRLETDQLRTGTPGASSSFGNLDAQARAAGLVPGTPQYQDFMLNGGGAPATFRALDMQARAAGFTPGTPEYNEFMATRGAGLQAGAAQTAKNVADIETGGAAAGAVDLGKASIKAGTEAWSDYGKLQTSIGNMDEAIAALDNGAQTGIIYKMLPNITEASASLQNAMDRMGLDVIGSVTFGALSEGEMRLAMQTAAPRDLPPAELRNWLAKKRDAQIKAADMLADAAQFLTKPGNTINDWIERNRSAKKAQGGSGQSSTGIQWSIED